MVRHLSTGTATIVALMAAHRLAQDQGHGSRPLDDFFRQEAARIDGCPLTPDRWAHRAQTMKRRTTFAAIHRPRPGLPLSLWTRTAYHPHASGWLSVSLFHAAPPQPPNCWHQAFDPDTLRVASNRNQMRRSVSSIQTSSKLAVATSPYSLHTP